MLSIANLKTSIWYEGYFTKEIRPRGVLKVLPIISVKTTKQQCTVDKTFNRRRCNNARGSRRGANVIIGFKLSTNSS